METSTPSSEIYLAIITGLAFVSWTIGSWIIVRMIKRADGHGHRLDQHSTVHSTLDKRIALQELNVSNNVQLTAERSKNVDERISRVEAMGERTNKDVRDLDNKITEYLLKPKGRGQI